MSRGSQSEALSCDERVATESIDRPFVHRDRSESAIEVDRGLVPVENSPLQPCVTPLDRDLSERHQQGFAQTRAAVFRHDVEILEIEPVDSFPG